jgi:ParB-like chromosome segregation protein Spo0J
VTGKPARTRIPINSVLVADSPRLKGESDEHIELLAGSETPLPPILVHRSTMRVVDGMHRLRAAQLRGQLDIEVEFFEGDDDAAFIAAVLANTEHGLPLSLADREAAAARILVADPRYSDRRLATITGLAPSTVTSIRRRIAPVEDGVRIGQDGRVRPVNSAEGRRIARDEIIANPGASLRQIARKAGISPSTVIDVRKRMNNGSDPVPVGQAEREQAKPQISRRSTAPKRPGRKEIRHRALLVQALRKDPSLRLTESGRALLRSLTDWAGGPGHWQQAINSVPPHCAYLVAELVRSCAAEWLDFAGQLEDGLTGAPDRGRAAN